MLLVIVRTVVPTKSDSDVIVYWYISPQMELSFFVLKILHEGFFTLKICMPIDIAKL